ncbi:MAG: alpha/beta hydrolase [Candidatus Microsaccharimonas sp.]
MFETFLHKYLRIPYRLHIHTDQKGVSPRATVLLLHGMGNSGASWDAVVKRLPDDVRAISIDLLGFGKSPSPRWMKYNISVQAGSVIRTLLSLNIRQPLIIVGHSMGSLTAIEIAKRYPLIVKALILCSPPIYSQSDTREVLPSQATILKQFYRLVMKNPEKIVSAVPLAIKLRIVGDAFHVNKKNVDIYMAALESSILHQTSYDDIQRIRKPIHIIHGLVDPVVIKKNLDQVAKANPKVKVSVIAAGHELMGAYIPAVVKAVEAINNRGSAV